MIAKLTQNVTSGAAEIERLHAGLTDRESDLNAIKGSTAELDTKFSMPENALTIHEKKIKALETELAERDSDCGRSTRLVQLSRAKSMS